MGRFGAWSPVNRSVLVAAASGIALGVSWVLLGGLGYLVSGLVLPVPIISYVIGARWLEAGLVLLGTGVVPLSLLLDEASRLPGTVTAPSQVAVPLGAAAVMVLVGAVVVAVVTIGLYRQHARSERLARRRR